MFPLQELSQGTKDLLRNSLTKSAFQPEKPGNKCSCTIVQGAKIVPAWEVVLSISLETLGVGFAGLTTADWSNGDGAATTTCVMLHLQNSAPRFLGLFCQKWPLTSLQSWDVPDSSSQ